ncbi:Ig-like domain-containing protein [Photobacterium damselae]|uniref:Ig-like domain-containing protein n=1 Tax=Photobacterium damselae TaxID=38293 RepID=UPI000D6674B6|nr:hypothetical protein [Photobacterium damselae]AWK84139.1 hypothetical protein BST98_19370 [Photobacterium damselae]
MFDRRFLGFSFLLVLLGCGGNDGNNNDTNGNSNTQNISINAQDLLTFSKGNEAYTVDLREKVIAEDGQSLIINNIERLDKNCSIIKKNGLTFDVYTNDSSICRFKYSVKPSSSNFKGNAEAIAQVVSTLDADKGEYLPPVSKTVQESGKISLDSSDLLIESGFEIDPNSVQLIGNTENSDIGTIESVDTSSIVYQAPTGTTGTVRIFYSEIDNVNNIVRPGIIYIAIGQEINNSPIAQNKLLPDVAIVNGSTNINVSSLVSDIDKDELQLVYVNSSIGNVEILDNNNIRYHPISSGVEYITYIIFDHNGGYGIGQLYFNTSLYDNMIDDSQKLTFRAPYSLSDLNVMDGSFSSLVNEDGSHGINDSYPSFTKDLASNYCEILGLRLPTEIELRNMFSNVLSKNPVFESKYKWHSTLPYLTSDNKLFSLIDGQVTNLDASSLGYFSCVESETVPNWDFSEKFYPASFNKDTPIYIIAKNENDAILFYPNDKYELQTEIESLRVNGEPVDSSEFSKYVKLYLHENIIRVNDISLSSDTINSMSIKVLDSVTSSDAHILLGVNKCPNNASPVLSDRITCINVIDAIDIDFDNNNKFKPSSQKFTTGLSENLLNMLGFYDLNSLPGILAGAGNVNFKLIPWNKSSVNERSSWLSKLNVACETLNMIKFDGRENWSIASNVIPKGENNYSYIKVSKEDADLSYSWAEWLSNISGVKTAYLQAGFIFNNINMSYIVQQAGHEIVFSTTDTKNLLLAPSCWSKN